ncbi:MAG: FtsX-like permease family protein [Acinetobacter sp.]
MNAIFKPLLLHSFRNQSIWLLVIALSVAICATTAVKFSNGQVREAVTLQAASMLAADLVLTDHQPIAEKFTQTARQQQLDTSKVTAFGSMARTQNQFVMVTVKAVEQNYPLRGTLRTEPNLQRGIHRGEVWLSSRARDLLQVKLGDTVYIADAALKFTALIRQDSNQETGFSGFSPTVIISQQDVTQTNAIQTGSRIEYRLLMRGTPQHIQAYQHWFKQLTHQNTEHGQAPNHASQSNTTANQDDEADNAESNLRLRDAKHGNSRLLKPLENLDLFLQLSNLLTLLLCGVAIALSSRRYVQHSQDQIALLRCLGASFRQIACAMGLLLLVVMCISAVFGSVAGTALGMLLLKLMLQFMPSVEIQVQWLQLLLQPLPVAFLTSACVLLGFIVPNIVQLLRIPPLRVLRPDLQLNSSRMLAVLLGLLSLVVLSLVLTQNLSLTMAVLSSILIIAMVFFGLIVGLLKLLKGLNNNASAYIRQPAQMAIQMTVLALGLSLISVLVVLRTDVMQRWQQQLPQDTPNQFVYGLPPMDKPSFDQKLQQFQWSHTPLYPNVRGRLVAKNGQAFSVEQVRQNNSLRRELNLTQSSQYPQDNTIVAGEAELKHAGEVSVEAKTAGSLGIQLGDELTFQLPEGELKAKVRNLRTVTWESFSPNFFFIFAPKTLDENAGSYLGSFYVPAKDKSKLLQLIQAHSNTVFIDVSAILDQVKHLMDVMIKVISVLATLVALSGFCVLLACLNLLMDERRQEVALLRAFGSSKQKIKQMFGIEFAFVGFVAGIIACIFAEAMSAIASLKLDMALQLHGPLWLVLPIFMAVLCGLIGRYRFRQLYNIAPLSSLRE